MERAELRALVLATGSAMESGGYVFLRDSKWGAAEQAQFEGMIQAAAAPCAEGGGWLCIPTGGTGGVLRFARHDEQTLGAAVRGFVEHFGVRQVNVLDVLPAHHVSGLMARIRCAETGGKRVAWTWKQLEAGDWPELPTEGEGWYLSLVPTQLQRLLASASSVERLKKFRAVFLGGGPLWPELVDAAAVAGVPVSICYGMTETAAMVTAQRMEDFAAGDRGCGRAMAHARVEIVDEVTGAILPQGATGLVRIAGEAIFRGYWPEATEERALLTEDLGRLDAQGRLTILGRRDAVIITGGKKVHPAEVEAVLRASGAFDDVAVIGVPDLEWGQVVVACYPLRAEKLDTEKVEAALEGLVAYKRPKYFLAISSWPRNAQGKIVRTALCAAAVVALEAAKASEF